MADFWKHFENTLFENTLKHTIWKPLKHLGDFWKHFETHYLETIWNTQFENHWNLWGILKTLWNTQFENTLKHILIKYNLKTIETYGKFENTLKYIIWKHFETHNLKTIETYGRFLKTLWNTLFKNTLKHTIWKPLKHLGDFLKHFENHIDTPLSYHHWGVTIETLGFKLALKWNTYVQPCMERKSAFFTLLNV